MSSKKKQTNSQHNIVIKSNNNKTVSQIVNAEQIQINLNYFTLKNK